MAHLISSVSGRDEVFTAGERPWHGLGVNVPNRVTAAEAIQLAGLDWTVEQVPLTMPDGTQVPDRVANVRRNQTGRLVYLGSVGTRYRPIQNRDSFGFFDEVVGKGSAYYETAGAIRDGRRVWVLARVPGDLFVANTDRIEKYVLLVNGHDGGQAFRMFVTPIRVVCNNTLTAALGRASESEGVSVRHVGDKVIERVEEAVRVLGIVNETYNALGAAFERFMRTPMPMESAAKYFRDVLAATGIKDNGDHEEQRDRYLTGMRTELAVEQKRPGRGTLWGAYNAVTGFADHSLNTKESRDRTRRMERRFETAVWGRGAAMKARAFEVAEAIAAK